MNVNSCININFQGGIFIEVNITNMLKVVYTESLIINYIVTINIQESIIYWDYLEERLTVGKVTSCKQIFKVEFIKFKFK